MNIHYIRNSLYFNIYFILFLHVLAADHQKNDNTPMNNSKTAEAAFRKLFKLERAEQLAAVKAILKIGKEDKQRKMVEAIVEKVFIVIRKSRAILENFGYIPGESSFPTDEKIQDALSNVLENTAFIGDIVLRLPDLTHSILKNHTEWSYLLKWSLTFTNQTQLVDSKTNILLDLVNQEMNFTQRHSNFTNPYRKVKQPIIEEVTELKKKTKKKKVLPRGPRLSTRQFGDL
ncbi:hypothetical protein O3M35_007306 [Rhynocoris fuscipes]|uniref:Coiled-coil domain-containing protein 134 n=1 Tax=Rhynocoris fuscipes TaxID=488301 RepID=A0AAW1D8Z4_9HEMI